MSEDKMEHNQDLKGGSRRSRKDEQGRDFVCGCGKRYLSYPALYTHIKTKHQGQQPQGTQKTGVAPSNKRTKPKIDDRILREIQTLVQLQNLNILTYLDENATGSIPLSYRIKKQHLSKQLLQTYNIILKSPSPFILDKRSTLQSALITYLIGVGQYVTSTLFYPYYCSFARYFRNCWSQYGNQIYDTCFKTDDYRKDRVLNLEECRLVPIVCDFFLRFYVPYQKKDNDFHNAMELICYDFCQWMYLNKLTIVQVSMKKDFQIKRNLIEPKSKQKKDQEVKQGDQDKQDKDSNQHHSELEDDSESEKEQQGKEMANEDKMDNASPIPPADLNSEMKSQNNNVNDQGQP